MDIRKELTDQVALVTGASQGIGRAIAQELARAGVRVALVARSAERLDETAELITRAGGQAASFPGDVLDQQAVEHTVQQITTQLGPIDILINNAGSHRALGPIWEVDPDLWWSDVETNLRSAFLCSRSVLPTMIERCKGCIIYVSSNAGNEPRPNSSAYSSSKAAMTRLMESVAASTQQYTIRVFAIHPGSVRTEMSDYLTNSPAGQAWVPEFRAIYDKTEIPPERAGELAVYLASGKADSLSGHFISVYDNITDLLQRAEEIQRKSLYTLRLRK